MLVAVSAAHGRHALTRLWAEHTASLGFDMVVVSITSDADGIVDHEHDQICHDFGIDGISMPNNPLAGKFNAAMGYGHAMGGQRFMILPSDDFVSPEWVEAARNHPGDYLIPSHCAIVDPKNNRAYTIHKNAPSGTLRFGAGRVVSRKAIEACGGELWPRELNRGLDTASNRRLIERGIKPTVVQTEAIPIADVKTAENIWGYNTWVFSSKDCTVDQALHMVSPEILQKIKAL